MRTTFPVVWKVLWFTPKPGRREMRRPTLPRPPENPWRSKCRQPQKVPWKPWRMKMPRSLMRSVQLINQLLRLASKKVWLDLLHRLKPWIPSRMHWQREACPVRRPAGKTPMHCNFQPFVWQFFCGAGSRGFSQCCHWRRGCSYSW